MKYTTLFYAAILLSLSISLGVFAAEGIASPQPSASNPGTSEDLDPFTGLNKFYGWGLGVVGLSALFMIVRGGLNYVVAGDNASRVSEGKKMITNALIGIVIAAASYAILYTINPNLVKLRIGTFDEYKTNK